MFHILKDKKYFAKAVLKSLILVVKQISVCKKNSLNTELGVFLWDKTELWSLLDILKGNTHIILRFFKLKKKILPSNLSR